MPDFAHRCFVCGKEIDPKTSRMNEKFNLPVCPECEGTEQEKAAIDELLDGLADGFVCGCI